MKTTVYSMRHELARVCDKFGTRDCRRGCCPLGGLCPVLGNPRTAKAGVIEAMYLLYKAKGERE